MYIKNDNTLLLQLAFVWLLGRDSSTGCEDGSHSIWFKMHLFAKMRSHSEHKSKIEWIFQTSPQVSVNTFRAFGYQLPVDSVAWAFIQFTYSVAFCIESWCRFIPLSAIARMTSDLAAQWSKHASHGMVVLVFAELRFHSFLPHLLFVFVWPRWAIFSISF